MSTKRTSRGGEGTILWLAVALGAPGGAAADDQPAPVHLRGKRDAANMPSALSRTNAQPVPRPTGAAAPSAAKLAPVVRPAPMVNEATHMPNGVDFNSCRKVPPGKRVRVTLKPDADLGDLLAWISPLTCKQFLLPGSIPANSKKVTIIAPQPMTVGDAFQLFLGALNSVDLTVEQDGRFLRIIETSRAKSAAIRFDPGPKDAPPEPAPADDPYVTRLVRLDHASAGEVAAALARLKGDGGDVVVATETSLIITDRAANVGRMLEVVRRLDVPAAPGADARP